nr:MAG: capsid protein [Cressdnaviricota sp.]
MSYLPPLIILEHSKWYISTTVFSKTERRLSRRLFRSPVQQGALAAYNAARQISPYIGSAAAGVMARRRFNNNARGRRSNVVAARRYVPIRSTRRAVRSGRSGRGTTTQHDRQSVYSKRSMPRGKKRQWRKFVSKVNAAAEKDLGTRTVVFNKSQAYGNTASTNQGYAYLALYSANGTGDSFMADLYNISNLENTGNPTAAAGTTVDKTTKFLFKSGILDITVRNTSSINLAGVQTAAPEAKLEVDVYEITSPVEWDDTLGVKSDVSAALFVGDTQTLNIGGAGTAIKPDLRGVTPWDMPAALSHYRLRIQKKTKYFLQNGETFTYQMRDPKRRKTDRSKMVNALGGNRPGWTKHLYFVFKLVPGLSIGTAVNTYTEQLTIGMTRKYFYKIMGVTEDRDQYLVA